MTNQSNEKSKNGKRLALILLALLLIAAIAFGAYTYSKYVTNQKGTGSATVAQWGYTVTIGDTQTYTDDFGFSKNYSNLGLAQDSATGAVISTVRSNNVVAPGAKGSFTFSIEGTAEVDAQLTASIANMKDIYITVKNDNTTLYYFPVLFTVTATGEESLPTNVTLWDFKTWAESFTKKLEAGNTDYSEAKEYTVSWAWNYSAAETNYLYQVSKSGTGYTIAKYEDVTFDATAIDTLDTALGYLAAKKTSAAQMTITDTEEGPWIIQNTNADQSFTPEASSYSLNIGFDFSLSLTQVMEQA